MVVFYLFAMPCAQLPRNEMLLPAIYFGNAKVIYTVSIIYSVLLTLIDVKQHLKQEKDGCVERVVG